MENFKEDINENGEKKYSIDGKDVSEKAYKYMMNEYLIQSAYNIKNKDKDKKNKTKDKNDNYDLCEHHEMMLGFINDLRCADDEDAINLLQEYTDGLVEAIKSMFYSDGYNQGQIDTYKLLSETCNENYMKIKIMVEMAEQGLLKLPCECEEDHDEEED